VRSEPSQPATLGSSAAAGVRLIVWCRDCRHQVEHDAAEQAQRYGAEMTVPDWRKRLVCSRCGSREIDMVVTGTKRRTDGERIPKDASFPLPGVP
jgi:reverse gyrase